MLTAKVKQLGFGAMLTKEIVNEVEIFVRDVYAISVKQLVHLDEVPTAIRNQVRHVGQFGG